MINVVKTSKYIYLNSGFAWRKTLANLWKAHSIAGKHSKKYIRLW